MHLEKEENWVCINLAWHSRAWVTWNWVQILQMEPKHLSDFVSNTLSAYIRVSLQLILPKNVVLLACLIKFPKIIVYSLSAETGKTGWWFLMNWHRLTEITGSFTKTILELPQSVWMYQYEVWIFYTKLIFITSGKHRKCWMYVVHLAQHSAPDSKTQHRAFTGTSHRVLMNHSQKCCCFLLAKPW